MKPKKPLCILLAVLLLNLTLTAFPFSVNAAVVDKTATAEVVTYQVSDSQQMQDAMTAINAAGAGEYVIELTADTGERMSSAAAAPAAMRSRRNRRS